ncbi:hypothetical protein BGX28_009463 [Mortierella sp. GBA30]|nr:hypothetical protein BGX28_009463 [Mortierella sp. GBA30]
MEWEREQDRNLPNIFAVPQALESELAASKQHDLKQTTSSFGSFSSSNGLQKESSFTSQLSRRQDKDQRLSSITDSGDKTSSFDMGSLRGDVLDKEQEKRQSLSRSSVGHDLGLQSSGRPRSNLQYRSHTEPSLWSDGDEDDTRDLDMDMDEDLDGHDRRLQKLSRNKVRGALEGADPTDEITCA